MAENDYPFEFITNGVYYEWSLLRMELITNGAYYEWSLLRMDEQ